MFRGRILFHDRISACSFGVDSKRNLYKLLVDKVTLPMMYLC